MRCKPEPQYPAAPFSDIVLVLSHKNLMLLFNVTSNPQEICLAKGATQQQLTASVDTYALVKTRLWGLHELWQEIFPDLLSYLSITWLWRCCRCCTRHIRPCGKYLKEILVIYGSIRVLWKFIPNIVKLIAGHTERMLIKDFMERAGADCTAVMCVPICERLTNCKRNVFKKSQRKRIIRNLKDLKENHLVGVTFFRRNGPMKTPASK